MARLVYPRDHSVRSAMTGSILVARPGRSHEAHSATSSSVERQREVDERVRRIDLEERLLHQPRHGERTADAQGDADRA